MHILMTGGGSAGHVTPNLALIPLLQERGHRVTYIGGEEGIERGLIEPLQDVPYHGISTGKLRRYASARNLTDPLRVIRGFFQARRLLGQIAPDVVFSKGGFVSVPVVYAAATRRIVVVAHESDMTPGLANKLCAPFIKTLCTSFPETAAHAKRGVYTGPPLRQSLYQGDREKGLARCGFSGEKPVLLSIGGSLGAVAINVALRAALDDLLPLFDIVHLCGKGNLDAAHQGRAGYLQLDYVQEGMPDIYAMSDLALSRAGSNVLCELLALRKPHLLVPYPKGNTSRGDQEDNARSFESRGFSRVLWQQDMTPRTLTAALMATWQAREATLATMRAAPLADGTMAVLAQIEGALHGR